MSLIRPGRGNRRDPRLPSSVVFHRGVPLVIPARWRRSAAYREYRRGIERATSYRQVLEQLEAVVRHPTAAAQSSAAADFAPTVAYARRFLNTTAAYRTRPAGDPRRQVAERGVRVLVALLTGLPERPGRKANVPLSHEAVMAVRSVFGHWYGIVRPLWRAAGDDRGRLPRLIEQAAAGQFQWSAAHARELRTLLRRRGMRPTEVAHQLTAWQLDLSVRRVRLGRRPHRQAETVYA